MLRAVLVFPESAAVVIDRMADDLRGHGFAVRVVYVRDGTDVEEPVKHRLLREAEIYVTGGYEPLRAADLEGKTSLRLIQRFGAGYDNVDCQAAGLRGIYVANTPGGNTASVADLTMGLILALLRLIPRSDAALRRGTWRLWLGHELAGKKLGLLGMGAIGKGVALRAAAHGMTVIAHDARPDHPFAEAHGIVIVSREELLATADVVSLHLPLTPETRGSFGEAELKRMKRSAWLINTARGAVVDQPALVRALRERWIAGAALDVFSPEPPGVDDELLGLENVVLTSHIGGGTIEALERLAEVTVDNCLRIQRGETPSTAVNKPMTRKVNDETR